MGEAGMIRMLSAALAVLAASACSSVAPTNRDLERIGAEYERQGTSPLAPREDTCGAAAHRARIGTELGDWEPPAGSRVIRPGDAVTRDLRRERLNVILDANGRITALECY
jgi:hypothetical protein